MSWQILFKRKYLGYILLVLIAASLTWWSVTSLRIQQNNAKQLLSDNFRFTLTLSELSRNLEDYNTQALASFWDIQDSEKKERAKEDFLEGLSLLEDEILVEDETVEEIERNFTRYTTLVDEVVKSEEEFEYELNQVIVLNYELRGSMQQLYIVAEAQQEAVRGKLNYSFNDAVTSMLLLAGMLTALGLLYLGIIPTIFE